MELKYQKLVNFLLANAERHKVSVRDFDSYPINFAWFMRGLSSASIKYPVFEDGNPYLAESLHEWIADENLMEMITDEQLRLFKNYSNIEPSWRKKESIACDLYFPILLALTKG